MADNDRGLIEKAQKGDIEAFEALVSAYQKKVFNIAFRMIGNLEDASDVSQEVFVKVYKSMKDFRGQSSFSTWIYRITVNVCMDELRKAKNKKVIYIDEDIRTDDGEMKREIEDDAPGPESIIEGLELKQVVSDAINALLPDHRVVLVLRDIQDFSYEEISRILNIPQGTVKSRINRARLILKDVLTSRKELWETGYVKYDGKEGLA